MNRLSRTIDLRMPTIYTDPQFRAMIESHMPAFRKASQGIKVEVADIEMVRWRGNLYGYLAHQQVELSKFWIILRLNDLSGPHEFDEQHQVLIYPDVSYLQKLIDKFTTTYNI